MLRKQLTFEKNGHHWAVRMTKVEKTSKPQEQHLHVHEGDNHSKTKSKIEKSFGCVVSHLPEEPSDDDSQEDVHVYSNVEITLGKFSISIKLKTFAEQLTLFL
jgi:hypothetical protein